MGYVRAIVIALVGVALLALVGSAFSSSTPERQAEAAAKKAGQKAGKKAAPKRCRDQKVWVGMGKSKRITLVCARDRKGKRTYIRIGGGKKITREILVKPLHGTVRRLWPHKGRVTYTPKKRFAGKDRFSYLLRSAHHGNFRGRVTITVVPKKSKPKPGAPSCTNTTATVAYAGSTNLTLTCTGNITSYQLLSAPQEGQVGTISGDTVPYTQTARSLTPDQFAFRAVGPGGESAAAFMTVNVTPPAPPTCDSKAVTTREGEPIDITAVCTGVGVDYEIFTPPSHGKLSDIGATSGQTVYTPSPKWFSPNNPPVPDSFQVTASNPGGTAPPATIDVTVLPDAPKCEDTSTKTLIDQPDTLALPCGNPRAEHTWEIVTPPAHGTLGLIDENTGRVEYTPDPGYFSPGSIDDPTPDSFTFRATNPGGTSEIKTAKVTVVPPPPICEPLDSTGANGALQNLTVDCTTAGGAPQEYELVSQLDPSNAGTLDEDAGFAQNGQLTYEPDGGFFTEPGDEVTFVVQAVNAGGKSLPLTGYIQVDAPTPTCDDFFGTTPADTDLVFQAPCGDVAPTSYSITQQPPAGQGSASIDSSGEVTFTPDPGFFVPEGDARVQFEYTAQTSGGPSTGIAHIDVLPPPPTCSPVKADAFYMTPTLFNLKCTGPELEYSVVTTPAHGEVDLLNAQTGNTRYTPAARFDGDDSFTVTASNEGGTATPVTVSIDVRPWEFRAIGDSVTAGFGFYGDGQPMSILDLLSCKPPTIVNDRCSSNSISPAGYAGTVPQYESTYGLSNGIAWPAQFALGVQGGGHVKGTDEFQNLAVTGSAPSDWLPAGALNPSLNTLLATEPDLLTFTMGANPLLSDILLTGAGEECAFTFTVASLQSCAQPFIDQVQLPQRLQALYTEILTNTGHTNVVVMPYHLAIPYANAYSAWQLEVLGEMINTNVQNAVAATQAALPADQSSRLYEIFPAGVNDTDQLELPRFNIGRPATIHDDWSGSYDCGWWFPDVDGPSNQSTGSQAAMILTSPTTFGLPWFCTGTPWILSTDTGIHPNVQGHTQFATTLENFTVAEDLVPPLP